jgi:sugar lactone lactonase YvrE
LPSEDDLGEGPFWDERREELLRVDITRGRVHGWSPATGRCWARQHDGEVSAVVPRAGGEGWVIAAGHRLVRDDGTVLARAEEHLPSNRFNDCKCDSRGRLWAGTMSKQRVPGAAALYRLQAGGELECVVAETTISNGLGWSPADDLMYFVDSTTQRIDVFDFDADSGTIANRRPFAQIDAADGLPDGLTIDAEGGVWLCLFGGGVVRRYGADGSLAAEIALPVTHPTSLAFGGPGLRTLYVTSARRVAGEALAGAVLALDAQVAGLPGNRFGG